ncbi:MAG: site-specific DNA-methyltransferase, partial [Methanobacterium sp.]
LLARIILASSKKGDLILDPFCGSSTTGIAANLLGRNFIGIDSEYSFLDISIQRKAEISQKEPEFFLNKIAGLSGDF